jgi:hypothetical protein
MPTPKPSFMYILSNSGEKANEMLLEANKITYVEKKIEAPAAEAVA